MHTIILNIDNMNILPQILFLIALGTAAYSIGRRVNLIRKTILLGKAENRYDNPSQRLKNMLLLAFGQKKMFTKPTVAILHLAVYLGFIIINLEVLEIVLDGILGTHRIFFKPLGGLYSFLINFFEILALAVILACVVFLVRRNTTKVERFQESRHREMKGWPVKDGNIILVFEIILMAAFLKMNAADAILQSRGVGHFAEAITGPSSLVNGCCPLWPISQTACLCLPRGQRGGFISWASWHLHCMLLILSTSTLPWHSQILIFRISIPKEK
jgi:hypothetical protein